MSFGSAFSYRVSAVKRHQTLNSCETLNSNILNMQKKRGMDSFLWDFNLQRALRHDDDEYDDEKNGVVVFLPQPRERERDLLIKTTSSRRSSLCVVVVVVVVVFFLSFFVE